MAEGEGGINNPFKGIGDKIVGSAKGKANQLYGKGKQQLNSVLGTRPGGAETTGFLRGDVVESAYDAAIAGTILNTKERVFEIGNKAGQAFENTAIQVKKTLATPITSPGTLVKNVALSPIVAANEVTDLAATTVGRGVKLVTEGYEGIIGRPVDRLAHQVREKIGYVPIVGGIVGGTLGGGLNLANRLASTPFKIANWTREKVGDVEDKYIFDKVRGWTMNEASEGTVGSGSGSGEGGGEVVDLAAERAKRQAANRENGSGPMSMAA